MNEIKACPFCGGEASLSDGYMGYSTVGYFIECIDCGASSHMNPDKNITTNDWNNRVKCGEC